MQTVEKTEELTCSSPSGPPSFAKRVLKAVLILVLVARMGFAILFGILTGTTFLLGLQIGPVLAGEAMHELLLPQVSFKKKATASQQTATAQTNSVRVAIESAYSQLIKAFTNGSVPEIVSLTASNYAVIHPDGSIMSRSNWIARLEQALQNKPIKSCRITIESFELKDGLVNVSARTELLYKPGNRDEKPVVQHSVILDTWNLVDGAWRLELSRESNL